MRWGLGVADECPVALRLCFLAGGSVVDHAPACNRAGDRRADETELGCGGRRVDVGTCGQAGERDEDEPRMGAVESNGSALWPVVARNGRQTRGQQDLVSYAPHGVLRGHNPRWRWQTLTSTWRCRARRTGHDCRRGNGCGEGGRRQRALMETVSPARARNSGDELLVAMNRRERRPVSTPISLLVLNFLG